jgi:predicted  nucleic acid-binding Zn-ribbon protein
MHFTFDIPIDLTHQEARMLDRALSTVASALAEAIRTELAQLGQEIASANARADRAGADLLQVNNQRIGLEQEVSKLKAEVIIARTDRDEAYNEVDNLKAEIERYATSLKGQLSAVSHERDAAQASATKWENEALELITTTDQTLAKVRSERDEAKAKLDHIRGILS